MTASHDHQPLSNLELLVLAQLSTSKGANEQEVADMLADVAPPDGPRSAREHVEDVLATLYHRLLATRSKPTEKTPCPPWKLTEEGRRTLCGALGLNAKPDWRAIKGRYLPALALGLSIESEQASKLGDTEELVLTVLRQHFKVPQASTILALCNALIAKDLEFAGDVTLLRLQTHVLTRGLGLQFNVASTKELEALAPRVASRIQDGTGDGRRPLRQVLGRHWVYKATSSPEPVPGPRPPAAGSNQGLLARTAPIPPVAQHPAKPPVSVVPNSTVLGHSSSVAATPADILLTLVREAIPRIGADGRFGDEKVFVSAIWQHLEDDGRVANWSLDRFKRWLVTANRDQLVDLARADAQGDMDSRLVEESEIVDQGTTFHFVVDRQVRGLGRGLHAR